MGNSRIFFLSLLLLAISFTGGYGLSLKLSKNSLATTSFITTRTVRPQVQFYISSFCQYDNQIEAVLQPVYGLLSTKVDFIPHYIFKKITSLSDYCNSQTDSENCLDPNIYLKSQENIFYTATRGRQEANQNIRELCAWKQVGDNKKLWWNFVNLVSNNCTADNADNCWEEQGQQAGLDTYKITECFNQNAFTLIESEIAASTKYQITSSPSILVNNISFTPETGSISLRTPNSIKNIICKSMTKSAKECSTQLPEISNIAPSTASCPN